MIGFTVSGPLAARGRSGLSQRRAVSDRRVGGYSVRRIRSIARRRNVVCTGTSVEASVELVEHTRTSVQPVVEDGITSKESRGNGKLWWIGKPGLVRMSFALLALLIATCAALAMPLAYAQVVRTIITLEPGQHSRLLKSFGKVLILYMIEPLATLFWVQTACKVTEEVVKQVKLRIFGDILSQEVKFFDKYSSGELTTAVAKDVAEIRDVVWSNLGRDRGLRAILEAVGVLTVLSVIQPKMAVLYAVVVPTFALIVTTLGKKLGKLAASESGAFARISGKVSEIFSGVRTVKSFSAEEIEMSTLDGMLTDAGKISQSIGRQKSYVEAGNRFAIYATLTLVSLSAGLLVLSGDLLPTAFLSFIGYVYSLTFAVQGISYTYSDISRARGTLKRVSDILESAKEAESNGIAVQTEEGVVKESLLPSRADGKIVFKNIDFAYPTRPDSSVFNDFYLQIENNKVTALVGPSGEGKSTIVSLLSRFYKPQKGSITLGGVDISEMDRKWYMDQVSLVSQDPVLFSGTIRDNITYGSRNSSATEAEIWKAVARANATDFINSLPQGLDTVLQERGSGLSGGQKQRIAIARAILKDAPILILDEATSALDTASEKLVQDALMRLMKGRTALVVAHRLSTVMSADKICVVYDGKIAEEGTHQQLMGGGESSIYKRLMKTQTSAFLRDEI